MQGYCVTVFAASGVGPSYLLRSRTAPYARRSRMRLQSRQRQTEPCSQPRAARARQKTKTTVKLRPRPFKEILTTNKSELRLHSRPSKQIHDGRVAARPAKKSSQQRRATYDFIRAPGKQNGVRVAAEKSDLRLHWRPPMLGGDKTAAEN